MAKVFLVCKTPTIFILKSFFSRCPGGMMEKERGQALPVPIGNSFFILSFMDKKLMRGAYPTRTPK